MQLDYWTVRGDIPTLGKKQRLYDSHAVETVMLIKQARDLGFDVNAAIAAAKEYQGIRDTQRTQTRSAAPPDAGARHAPAALPVGVRPYALPPGP